MTDFGSFAIPFLQNMHDSLVAVVAAYPVLLMAYYIWKYRQNGRINVSKK